MYVYIYVDAVNTTTTTTTLSSMNISVGFVTQIASFIIILLLSVQWQRMNAKIGSINQKLDHLVSGIDRILLSQHSPDGSGDSILGLGLGLGKHHCDCPHAESKGFMMDATENVQAAAGSNYHHPVLSRAEISQQLRAIAARLDAITDDINHAK